MRVPAGMRVIEWEEVGEELKQESRANLGVAVEREVLIQLLTQEASGAGRYICKREEH